MAFLEVSLTVSLTEIKASIIELFAKNKTVFHSEISFS
jgi:hypothetical protein